MAIPPSKNLYEHCSIAHFEALEQTQVVCGNFHGMETNTYFPVNGVDQGHSTGVRDEAGAMRPATRPRPGYKIEPRSSFYCYLENNKYG